MNSSKKIQEMDSDRMNQASAGLSEDAFRSLYNNATIGLYRTTPEGQIVMINPTGLRLLGFDSLEELAKRNLEETGFEQKYARRKFREKLEREGVISDLESHWVKKDGSIIDVREGATVLRDESGKVVYYDGSFEDITRLKLAEEELKQNINFTNALLEATPTPIFYKDSKGRYQGCNRAFTDIMGVTSEEIRGKTVHQLWPSENAEIYHQKDLELMQNPEHQVYEATTTDKDGNTRPVIFAKDVFIDESGNVAGLVGAFIDITERKQAEEKIRISEDRFRRFTEATVEGVVFHEQGSIIDVNPAAGGLFGFSDAAELIGRNLLEFVAPESRELVLKQMQLEVVAPYEIQCIHKDGTIFPVETSTRSYHDGERIIRATSIRNVTERKQTEEALHQTRMLYQSLVESSPMSICRKDLAGRFTFANQRFLDASKTTLANLVGKTDLDLHPSELADKYRRDDLSVMESGQVKELIEERAVHDGEITYIETVKTPIYDEEGKVSGIQVSSWDITTRKQTEEEMHRLQNAIEQAGDGIALADLNGNVLYTNPAWANMHGYTVEETLGKHLSVFHTQEQLENEVAPFNEKAMATGGCTSEIGHVRKDGTTFPTLMTVSVQKNDKDQPVGLIGTIRDITENKRVERELQENQKFLTLVLDTMPGFLFWKDRNSVYLGSNKLFAKGAGLNDPSEIVGKSDHELAWTKEEADAYIKDDRDVMESNIPKYHIIEPQLQANGKQTWVDTTKIPLHDAQGNVIGILGTFEDITERKQAEEERSRLAQLVQSSSEFINMSTLDGKMIFLSNAGCEMVGIDPQKLDQHVIFEVLTEESLAKVQSQVLPILMEKGAWSGELQYRNLKTGNLVDCQASTFMIYKENGEPLYLANISRDITENKKLELEVQEAFERRGYQVQISTEISQEVASASELSDLYERVVTLTKERLGYYHAQILRYDATQDAVVLINGYGKTGRTMLESGHKMPLGSGLIGTAAENGETILRPTLAEDPDWQPNPLLPETKGEIAVPIKLNEQILGVLDVQSSQAGALSEDDRLLLEGLCGQIAVAIEQTRLRQEMTERLEEINRLYQNLSHEGWKSYREAADLPKGFMFDTEGTKPVENIPLENELFANIPMKVMGGEVVGNLAVSNDPQRPMTPEDLVFLQQVSDQVALALEGARLTAQTQDALAQTEKLYEASRAITATHNEVESVTELVKRIDHTNLDRVVAAMKISDEPVTAQVIAVWDRNGMEDRFIGNRFTDQQIPLISKMSWDEVTLINDFNDASNVDLITQETFKALGVKSAAIVPISSGGNLMGWVLLETTRAPHQFGAEVQSILALAGQSATVIQGQRLLIQSQKQAEREGMLNVISQKIQSATTVEAVLQIAARELGHALGAPMTIAQLSMKDKK